ncbi:DUF2280 domain-containing protein [Caulobacter sp. SSI4214]|uniref:DUF2280 domain-containing protein n=1 Tax=Caulobacter sp. SSI4214 TaxID=2575739 RepID=UPI00143B4EB9|nr:DUF2280 domain-containing protein [Caulobacter sp. SSI4214]
MAGKGEPKLNDAARAFVVTALACFDAPSVVAEAVRKEFGFVITPQSIEGYDPTKRAGAKLSAKWVALFNEARKAFTEETATIGISHKATRLRMLQRMAERSERQGNIALAANLLEQAAKEMGNAYTNTRILQGAVAVTTPKTLDDFYGGNSGS